GAGTRHAGHRAREGARVRHGLPRQLGGRDRTAHAEHPEAPPPLTVARSRLWPGARVATRTPPLSAADGRGAWNTNWNCLDSMHISTYADLWAWNGGVI